MKKNIIKILRESEFDWAEKTGEPFEGVIKIKKKTTGIENVVKMDVDIMFGDGDSYTSTVTWFVNREVNPTNRYNQSESIGGKSYYGLSSLNFTKTYLEKLDDNNGWCEDCCDDLGLTEDECELAVALGLIKYDTYGDYPGSLNGVSLTYYDGSGNQHDASF